MGKPRDGKKIDVPTLATPRNYIDGKRREERSWESRGSRVLTPATSHQFRGAREVAGQLFTGFWPTQAGHKSPGAFVQKLVQKPWRGCTKAPAQLGQRSKNKRYGPNAQSVWELLHEVVTTWVTTTGGGLSQSRISLHGDRRFMRL